jgi:hypothetical protein
LPTCSPLLISEIPLATQKDYFSVALLNNIPGLTWSAEYDQNAVFEIERSYDGINFSVIKSLPLQEGQSEYNFSDRQVNMQSRLFIIVLRQVN